MSKNPFNYALAFLLTLFAVSFILGIIYGMNNQTKTGLEECTAKGGNLEVRTRHSIQCVKVELK